MGYPYVTNELFRIQSTGNNFCTNSCNVVPRFIVPCMPDMISRTTCCTPVFNMPSLPRQQFISGYGLPMPNISNIPAAFINMPDYLNGTYSPISKQMFIPYSPIQQFMPQTMPQINNGFQSNPFDMQSSVNNIIGLFILKSLVEALNETLAQSQKPVESGKKPNAENEQKKQR